MIGMQLASRLANLVDHRKLMAAGLLTLGFALHSMSYWTPDVSQHQMMLTLMLQGFAIGFVFNPMTVMAFTTLPPALRGYATSLQSLCRNIGQAAGRVGHLADAGAEHADLARRHRRGDHAVRSRAAGQRRGVAHAGSGDAAWRGDAGSDDQPPGADHRLQQRLPHDDAGGGAAVAVAAVDAPARAAAGGEHRRRRGTEQAMRLSKSRRRHADEPWAASTRHEGKGSVGSRFPTCDKDCNERSACGRSATTSGQAARGSWTNAVLLARWSVSSDRQRYHSDSDWSLIESDRPHLVCAGGPARIPGLLSRPRPAAPLKRTRKPSDPTRERGTRSCSTPFRMILRWLRGFDGGE